MTVHIFYAGRRQNLEEVDIEKMSDKEIKASVANYLEISEKDLSGFNVVRHQNGNATVRPDATLG